MGGRCNGSIRSTEGRNTHKGIFNSENVLREAPTSVLANQRDLPGAVSITEPARELELKDTHGRPWHIMHGTLFLLYHRC